MLTACSLRLGTPVKADRLQFLKTSYGNCRVNFGGGSLTYVPELFVVLGRFVVLRARKVNQ